MRITFNYKIQQATEKNKSKTMWGTINWICSSIATQALYGVARTEVMELDSWEEAKSMGYELVLCTFLVLFCCGFFSLVDWGIVYEIDCCILLFQ